MIIDMINCPVKFFHEKIIYQDTIYNGNGKIRCWFRKTTEEVGKDENKKKEDFFEVRLTEEKFGFPFYIDLRSDERFKCCHDLLRSKNPKEQDFYETFVKGWQQPSFKLSAERWAKVKECIKNILK